jgi:hypothetical protein
VVARVLVAWLMVSMALAQEPATRIVLLARELAAKPNDPELHARIAVAYFERGAQGDAQRAMDHRDRAQSLDPDLAAGMAGRFEAVTPGFDTREPTAEMQLADMQADATVGPARPGKGDEVVKQRLASRLARTRFEMPDTKFDKNRERVRQMFHAPEDPAPLTAERAGAVGAAGRVSPDALEKGFIEAVKRRQKAREEAESQRKADPAKAHLPPDPMLTKARAYLALLDGDTAAATAHLEETVAAAETLARLQLEQDGAELGRERTGELGSVATGGAARREDGESAPKPVADDDWGDEGETTAPPRVALVTPSRNETPERTSDATPERVDTTPPPRAQTPDRAGPVPAPPREQPPAPTAVAPPQRNRLIGQAALESLETTRTPEVPPPDVKKKVRDLATINEVGDPLLVDLDGDGRPSVPGGLAPDGEVHPRARVRFDLDADGHAELVEWMAPGDAIVCFDLDGDGRIASGREIAGAVPGRGHAADWIALRDLDGDGALAGAELAGCVLWRDDGDALCEPGEVVEARAAGVTRLSERSAEVAGARRRAVWDWLPDVR